MSLSRRSSTYMSTMPYTIHNPPSFTLSRTPAWLSVGAVAFLLLASPASGQLALPPALDPAASSVPPTHALGDWGESVVREQFKARGFETYVPQVGRNGLDMVAIKRGPNGEIIDARVVEVKTRTAAGDIGAPGTSRNGEQLSPSKVAADLDNAARNHPDPKTREVAREVSEYSKRNPGGLKAERHVITLKDGKYTVYEGPTAKRPIGRPVADASLEKTLERLAKSSDPATAKTAQQNLNYLREQQATAVRAPARAAVRVPASMSRATVSRLAAGESGLVLPPWPKPPFPPKYPVPKPPFPPKFPIPKGPDPFPDGPIPPGPRTPIPPRSPVPSIGALGGALGAGVVTGGVETAFILVAYNKGEISAEECNRGLCGAVLKAGAVSAATAAALAAGAPFIIVAAGGMVAYVAADYLWDAMVNPGDQDWRSVAIQTWQAWPRNDGGQTGPAGGCYDRHTMGLGAETYLLSGAVARPAVSASPIFPAGGQS